MTLIYLVVCSVFTFSINFPLNKANLLPGIFQSILINIEQKKKEELQQTI